MLSLLWNRQSIDAVGELILVSSEFLLRCFSPLLRGSHGSTGADTDPVYVTAGESAKVKAEKAEAVVPQGNCYKLKTVLMSYSITLTHLLQHQQSVFSTLVINSKVATVSTSITEVPIKVPTHNIPGKSEPWKSKREESLWGGDIDGKTALHLLVRLQWPLSSQELIRAGSEFIFNIVITAFIKRAAQEVEVI